MPSRRFPNDYETVTPVGRAPLRAGEDDNNWPVRQAVGAGDEHSAGDDEPHEFAAGETSSPAPAPESAAPGNPQLLTEHWGTRRGGHLLSYLGIYLFTFILYYRPYEQFAALAGFTSMAFWSGLLTLVVFFPTQFALEGTLTARPREVNLVLLFALTALLSIPLAISPGEGWATFNDPFVKAVLMFIVMVNVLRTERRLKWLMFLALSAGAVLSVGALNNYRLGNLEVEGYRIAGVLGNLFRNPNDMATHLVTMLPIAVAFMFSTRGLHKRLLYGALVGLLVGGTVVSFSRAGFLGLAAGTFVLVWKIGRRNRVVTMLLVTFGLLAFLVLAPGNYYNRLFSIYDNSRDAVGSATARRELLIRSIIVALRHPLFGIGIGNFHIMSVHEAVSHNAYTQVASEMGMTAMVLYTMFIVTPIRRLRQIERETFATRRGSRFYYLAVGLQASLVAYMVSSFFASVAYQWYVYYLVGYAVALRRIYTVNRDALAAAKEAEAQLPAATGSEDADETDVLAHPEGTIGALAR